MKKILPVLLLSVSLLACNPDKKIVDFYHSKKTDIDSLKALSGDLYQKYTFEYLTIRKLDVGIKLSVHESDPYKGTGRYYHAETLEPTNSMHENVLCDSCSEVEVLRYHELLNDRRTNRLLKLYIKTNAKALQITSTGLFLALGDPIESSHPDMEGGVLVIFGDGIKELSKRKIEGSQNAFIHEAVVQ